MSADVISQILDASSRYGVDPSLALGIANAESGYNPSAVSPKGAVGVMQLMPKTAAGLGVDPSDPAQNIDGGVRYIKQLSDQFGGDQTLTAAAYNAGPQAVQDHGGVPPYPETQAYVKKVTGSSGDSPGGLPPQSQLDGLFGVSRPGGPAQGAGGGQSAQPSPMPSGAPSAPSAPVGSWSETPISAEQAAGMKGQTYGQTADQSTAWENDSTSPFQAPASYVRIDPATGAAFLRQKVTPIDPNNTPPQADLDQLFGVNRGTPPQPDQAAPEAANSNLPPPNTYGGGDPGPIPLLSNGQRDPIAELLRSSDATVRGLANGMTFGAADKVAAAAGAIPAFLRGGASAYGQQYSSNMNAQQARDAADVKAVPWAAAPSDVAGVVAQTAFLPELRGANIATRALGGALQGAALNGLGGFVGSRGGLGEMSKNAGAPMAVGALLGGPLGALFGRGASTAGGQIASMGDYARTGVDPMLAVNGAGWQQRAGQMLKGIPGAGQPLVNAAAKTAGQLDQGVIGAAKGFGNAATPYAAGGALQEGAGDAIAGMRAQSKALYRPINAMASEPTPIPATATRAALDNVFGKFSTPAMQQWFAKNAPHLVGLRDTLAKARDQMTFGELKALRTDLGGMTDNTQHLNSMDQGRIKQLYGAMSDDLEAGAYRVGGAPGLDAWRTATAHENQMHEVIDQTLGTILGPKNSPLPREAAFAKLLANAQSGTRADLEQIQQVKAALPPAAWNEFSAGTIMQMGRDNGHFSAEKFADAWGKITPEAKEHLFGDAVGDLNAFSRVAEQQKAAGKFYNHTNSGHVGVGALLVAEPLMEAAKAVMEGQFHRAAAEVAAPATLAGLGYGAAKLLASPKFARLAAGSAKATPATIGVVDSSLRQYANDNPEVGDLVNRYRTDFMRRVGANAPVTTVPALAGQSVAQMLRDAPRRQASGTK